VDIGAYIKSDVAKYAMEKHNIKLTVKYLDPMYAIRTVPANCDDTVLCSRLGTVAVHGIIGGYTDFSVGLVRDELVMIPIDILVEAGSKKMKRKDYDWQRLISSTGQWNFLSQENYKKVIEEEFQADMKRKKQLLDIKYKAQGKDSKSRGLFSDIHID
jgi:6-phosphofructokinase